MKNKYITVTVSGIIISVGEATDTQGYTKSVIEAILPDDVELDTWSVKQQNEWIRQNNKRMIAICKLMNDKNL